MALTQEDIDAIEALKRRLDTDNRLGTQTSKISQESRVRQITVEEGIRISEENFNPTIQRIIDRAGAG